MNKETIKIILLRTLPVMTGYIVLGIGFGIMLNQAGYGIGWSILMSSVIYSGTMQYVGVSLISGGASIFTTIMMALAINARYLFYGLSLIDRYRGSGIIKSYLIFAITDETYALICSSSIPSKMRPHSYYFAVSFLNQIYWIFGCAMGSLIGSNIKLETKGVEFALTALIISIFVDQWKTTEKHFPAIFGVSATVICLFLFGRENFLLPALLILVVGLILGRRWIDEL
ncbi:MAG: AzlC family ABC transporter permease [Eubacterium sp.]|nr:AzlC family ABC transporter permease [Eubacterium sp.]